MLVLNLDKVAAAVIAALPCSYAEVENSMRSKIKPPSGLGSRIAGPCAVAREESA